MSIYIKLNTKARIRFKYNILGDVSYIKWNASPIFRFSQDNIKPQGLKAQGLSPWCLGFVFAEFVVSS